MNNRLLFVLVLVFAMFVGTTFITEAQPPVSWYETYYTPPMPNTIFPWTSCFGDNSATDGNLMLKSDACNRFNGSYPDKGVVYAYREDSPQNWILETFFAPEETQNFGTQIATVGICATRMQQICTWHPLGWDTMAICQVIRS